MAWNPSPDVAALREFAAKFNRPIVVTLSIEPDGQRFHVTTFGKTQKLCKLAASFGEQIAKRIGDGTIVAPSTEPGEVPAASVWERKL